MQIFSELKCIVSTELQKKKEKNTKEVAHWDIGEHWNIDEMVYLKRNSASGWKVELIFIKVGEKKETQYSLKLCTEFFMRFEKDWTVVAGFCPRQRLYQNALKDSLSLYIV